MTIAKTMLREEATTRLEALCRGVHTCLTADERLVLFRHFHAGGAQLGCAMYYAVCDGYVELVEAMLDAGCVPEEDVFLFAFHIRNYEVMALLARVGHIVEPQLKAQWLDFVIRQGRHVDWQRLLIESYGVPVNNFGRNDTTPLIEACRSMNDALALYLIEQGADIDAHAPEKWCARAYAKRYRKDMPLTWARIARHELTRKAGNARRGRAGVNDEVRRSM
jgi:hypothetical protein